MGFAFFCVFGIEAKFIQVNHLDLIVAREFSNPSLECSIK